MVKIQTLYFMYIYRVDSSAFLDGSQERTGHQKRKWTVFSWVFSIAITKYQKQSNLVFKTRILFYSWFWRLSGQEPGIALLEGITA